MTAPLNARTEASVLDLLAQAQGELRLARETLEHRARSMHLARAQVLLDSALKAYQAGTS